MWRAIEQLQNGIVTPKSFRSTFTMNRLFNLELSRHTVKSCHTSGITSMDLESIENRYLLSGAKNGDIVIHDVLNTTEKPSYCAEVVGLVGNGTSHEHGSYILRAQWYPCEARAFVTSAMDQRLRIWDSNALYSTETIKMENEIAYHDVSTFSTLHPLIAVALKFPHVVLLDSRTGEQCQELRGHRCGVNLVKWSPSSEFVLASGGEDNKILLWDIRFAKDYLGNLDKHNGKAIGGKKAAKTAHSRGITSMKFTDDGLYLSSLGTDTTKDTTMRLWDVALCKNIQVKYHVEQALYPCLRVSIDLCCDSSRPVVFIPCNNHAYFTDLFHGWRMKYLYYGHTGFTTNCVYRSSTHELYTCGDDMRINVWSPDVDTELEYDDNVSGSTDSDFWSSDENSDLFDP